MLKLTLYVLSITLATSTKDVLEHSALRSKTLNLTGTYFGTLADYQVNAKAAKESRYPWIARVIHSQATNIPHVCTAVCIDEAIYITASRCIYTLKVNYTTVIHMSKRFETRAFVVPSKPTKQAYDDIGFIVVDKNKFKGTWEVIELFNAVNRTDKVFKWFSELDKTYGPIDYKVVGYAMKKGPHNLKESVIPYDLSELNVVAGRYICVEILTQYSKLKTFYVPCYHSCTFQEFDKKHEKCSNYHGVEGGAVLDTKRNKLMGIATWGTYYPRIELPVGFSVANSPNFYKDLRCAKRIRDDTKVLVKKGYYQRLCNRKQ